ncbi:MAG: hypothetical protein IIB45_00695 [Candidatus Marinimicrobia bacterium]|nr:hypothetical protein [Candidatus Neomarinimicrobiota bacterium]
MNFRLALFGLLLSVNISANPANDLDSLKNGLQFFQYKKIDVTLTQFQYGEWYNSTISISFIDTTRYLVISNDQDIFVSGDLIKTWNKKSNQLIIDRRLDDEGDVFALLTGNLKGLSLQDKRNENGFISFGFLIQDFGLKGTLKVDKSNWHLRQIKIEYDHDNWLQLKIDKWQFLTENISFDEFGKNAEEVIDFNE